MNGAGRGHVMPALKFLMALSVAVSAAIDIANAQGIFILGAGAVNRSMGSAATAAPIDAAGALNYNPATMTGLRTSEAEFGLEFAHPDATVASEAFGLSGSTDSDSGVTPIPVFALVQKGSPFTFGLGFLGVAGFRADYPADGANPILAPPQSGGFGHIVGSADFYQLVPAASYAITPSLSVGLAPILTIGKIEANPFIFAPPDANGRYPRANSSNYGYGGGFELGLFQRGASGVNLGAAFKSPQWMESFTVNAADESGLSRRASVHIDLPPIFTAGASYTGLPQWVFAADLRYVDYEDASGFHPGGFDSRGALQGLGWRNIFSVSTGIQYSPCDAAALRIGYSYHQNPIDSDNAAFNIGAPVVVKHVLALGLSYAVVRDAEIALSYMHGFESSVSGPIVKPGSGAVPGTSVTDTASGDSVAIELTRRWQ